MLTFTDMIPVEAPDGSVYIDVRPTALSEGRRGLCASLSEGDRLDLLIEGCVDEVLVAALAEGESCAPVLVQTLNDPEVAARCVTGAEARLYCEAQGKRLPTPVEWAAAEAVLEVDSLGEWVMAEVHGTPAFEVVVPDGVSGVPAQLDVDEGSDRVGFRCAYSF